MIGTMILFGGVILAGLLSGVFGLWRGRITNSSLVASLTSLGLYSSLLFGGCWLPIQW